MMCARFYSLFTTRMRGFMQKNKKESWEKYELTWVKEMNASIIVQSKFFYLVDQAS